MRLFARSRFYDVTFTQYQSRWKAPIWRRKKIKIALQKARFKAQCRRGEKRKEKKVYKYIYSSPFSHSSFSQNMEMNMNLYFSACSHSSSSFLCCCFSFLCCRCLWRFLCHCLYLAQQIMVFMSYLPSSDENTRNLFSIYIYKNAKYLHFITKDKKILHWLDPLAPIAHKIFTK